MAYNFPSWYPFPDDNGDPVVMQPPVIDRRLIDATAGSTDDILANFIIDQYSSVISSFIQSSRHNYALGIVPIHDRSLELPGLGIRHQVQYRREIVTLTARPRQANFLTDLNFDGYVAWVHFPGGYTGKLAPAYDLFVNGYKIFDRETPDNITAENLNAICYMVLFGDTALRCQSLSDAENPFKVGIVEPGSRTPVKLTNKILPPRKQVNDQGDLPIYPIFNWPSSAKFLTRTPPGPPPPQILDQATPLLVKGLQFDSAADSPLVVTGFNNVTLWAVTNVNALQYEGPGDFLIAEFYDRKQSRLVSQSWHSDQSAGQSILVNDNPLAWMQGSYGEAYSEWNGVIGGMDFDLTPRTNYAVLNDQPVEDGGADPNPDSVDPPRDGTFDAAELAWETAYAAWTAGIAPLQNAMNAAYSTFLDAFNAVTIIVHSISEETGGAFQILATSTYNYFMLAHSDANGAIVGLISELGDFMANVTAGRGGYESLYSDALAYDAAHGTEWYAYLQANDPSNLALSADASTFAAAALAYGEYLATAPAPPSATAAYGGKVLSPFRYRTITVNDKVWDFSDWTKPPLV